MSTLPKPLKRKTMGSKAKKPRAMRSRRSGVKKKRILDANLAILNKLAK